MMIAVRLIDSNVKITTISTNPHSDISQTTIGDTETLNTSFVFASGSSVVCTHDLA